MILVVWPTAAPQDFGYRQNNLIARREEDGIPDVRTRVSTRTGVSCVHMSQVLFQFPLLRSAVPLPLIKEIESATSKTTHFSFSKVACFATYLQTNIFVITPSHWLISEEEGVITVLNV